MWQLFLLLIKTLCIDWYNLTLYDIIQHNSLSYLFIHNTTQHTLHNLNSIFPVSDCRYFVQSMGRGRILGSRIRRPLGCAQQNTQTVRIGTYVRVCVRCVCEYMCACVCVCMYVCMYVYMCGVCVYGVCVYVCMGCVCVCVYVYMYGMCVCVWTLYLRSFWLPLSC